MAAMSALESEVLHCGDCKLWNDGAGFDPDKTFEVWTLKNGMSLGLSDGGQIPFHSEYVPCAVHEAKLQQTLVTVP